ncbi:GGDEF domain-containing protein [Ectothiorhodospiraceae bacterium WFHF3C12]|nr:GGDEF domain-containing protein [Ectothiorhodospiraceae bacterium WFHF3C12]
MHTILDYCRVGLGWLRAVHAPERLRAKGAELGRFGALACLITAVFVAGTPVWDYAIDPEGAYRSAGLRMAEALAILLLAGAMWWRAPDWILRAGLVAVPVFVQITFIEILGRLEGGPAYGMGGFLYFFIFVPFMAMAQGLGFTVALLALIGLLPNLLVFGTGFGAHLDLGVYNAYVWMVYPPVVGILLLLESLQLQIFRQRLQLARFAHTDSLTGLPNRRHFIGESSSLLAAEYDAGRSAAVLFVDADRFKAINDAHGHHAGDRVLQVLARTIAGAVRDTDMVARYGGEEFVVFMPATGLDVAEEVAERIRRHVAETSVELGGTKVSLRLTVSIGVAATDRTRDLHALLEMADAALLDAKRAGRNRLAVA